MANRTAFYEATIKLADEKIDEFYHSWKMYRAANPVATKREALVQDHETEALVDLLLNGDNESGEGAAADGGTGVAAVAATGSP